EFRHVVQEHADVKRSRLPIGEQVVRATRAGGCELVIAPAIILEAQRRAPIARSETEDVGDSLHGPSPLRLFHRVTAAALWPSPAPGARPSRSPPRPRDPPPGDRPGGASSPLFP